MAAKHDGKRAQANMWVTHQNLARAKGGRPQYQQPVKKGKAKPDPKAEAEAKVEDKPKVEAEPKVEDKPKVEAEPKVEAKSEPKATAKPKAKSK